MSIIDKIKLNGTTYDVGKILDTTLTHPGQAADAKKTGDKITQLKSDLINYNAIDALTFSGNPQNRTYNGITFTFSGNTCTVVGTSTASAFANIYSDLTALPSGIAAGSNIYVKVDTTDSNARLAIVFYKSDRTYYPFEYITADSVLFVPSDTVGFIARVDVPSGKTVNATIKFAVLTAYTNKELGTKISSLITAKSVTKYASNNQITLSDITEDGFYVLPQNYTVTDAPTGLIVSGLTVERFSTHNASGFVKQTVESLLNPATSKKYYRISNNNGSAWSEWVEIGAETLASSLIQAKLLTKYISNNTLTLSDVNEDGFYVISTNATVTDAPSGLTVTGLTVERFSAYNQSGFVKQIAEDLLHPTTTKRYCRLSNYNGSAWSEWVELSGDSHTNEYVFNEYHQTVELSASPQITADTNNYLAPTGDTTDRTADILAMLTSSKVCRLGTGDYYINGLQMPDNSAIIGSGYGTKIYLTGTADGFAIKPESYCTLRDFMLIGSNSGLTFGDTIGGRHGILWQGNYAESQTAPSMCIMSNLYIRGFSGGGITCYDTGYGTFNAIEATNIIVLGCWAGLNISYWSEFHKFTNVRCQNCRVGCVNNGGNNVFVNCDFSSSREIGMLMDNSQNQSPNNSHGSCIGCVFNHTASAGVSNSGIGIKILNCDKGFIFSGCQIFFSQIDLDNSAGIVFSNCNFGYSNCVITIDGGKAILFTGNIYQNTPTITITNNADVHFVNCYNRTTGEVVSA